MFLSVFAFSINSTNAQTNANSNSLIVDALSSEVIEKADAYIELKNEKYVLSKELKNEVTKDEFKQIKEKVKDINKVLESISAAEFKEANIDGNVINFNEKTNDGSYSIMRSSGGKNGIEVHWWGYKLFLNDNLTRTTAQALAAGSGSAAIVALWAPWFSAPTAIVKAVAQTVVIVFGGASATLLATNNGNGVYLRFTGILPSAVVFTGVHPQ